MVKFIEDEQMKIRKEVLEMWTLVYDQMKNVCEALLTADTDKAWDVVIREKRVNAYELKIDCDIEDFLVLYNPVAIDLRFMVAMLKINTDLERIGDFAENIARFVIRQGGEPIPAELLDEIKLKQMSEQVLDMLSTSKQALEQGDINLAHTLFEKDNGVDEINANVTPVLAKYVKANPDKAEFCFDFKGIFLRLERTGDHVTNLAEEIIFYIDAVVLKHSEDKSVKAQALMEKMKEGNHKALEHE